MGEAQPQDPPAARSAEPVRAAGGFWQSLPGILTAAGTFLAGLAGLAAVIVPSLTAKHVSEEAARPPANAPAHSTSAGAPDAAAAATNPPAAEPTHAAAHATAPAPVVHSPPPAHAGEAETPADDRYVAAYASDGFVVLRAEPTIASAEIRRVDVGVAVRCGKPHWAADGYHWRRCVDQQGEAGYMADTFLRKGG